MSQLHFTSIHSFTLSFPPLPTSSSLQTCQSYLSHIMLHIHCLLPFPECICSASVCPTFSYLISHTCHVCVCANAAILSALRNLQEKIRRLELDKEHAEHGLQTVAQEAPRVRPQSENMTRRLFTNQTETPRETTDSSNCNQGQYVIKIS